MPKQNHPDGDRVRSRERLIDEAIYVGKFPRSRRNFYRAMYDRDPVGTRRLISLLAAAGPALARAAERTPPRQPPQHKSDNGQDVVPLPQGGFMCTAMIERHAIPDDHDYPQSWLTPAERRRRRR